MTNLFLIGLVLALCFATAVVTSTNPPSRKVSYMDSGIEKFMCSVVSPNGKNLYSISNNGQLVHWDRNIATGGIRTKIAYFPIIYFSLTLFNLHIYVFTSISSFLCFVLCLDLTKENVISGDNGGWGIAISPDGKNIYTCAGGTSKRVSYYTRDISTGVLSNEQHATFELGGDAQHLVVSPDNNNVYMTAYAGTNSDSKGGVVYWKRNLDTGALTDLQEIIDVNMIAAYHLALSPGGEHLYIAHCYGSSGNDYKEGVDGTGSVALFSRNVGRSGRSGHTLLNAGQTCDAKDGEQDLNSKNSVAECASACRAVDACTYFVYGTGENAKKCFYKKTTEGCTESGSKFNPPVGHTLLKAGNECAAVNGETDLEEQDTLAECAAACRATSGCKYFIYGQVGTVKANRCYWEKTTEGCTESGSSWDPALYDFYTLEDASSYDFYTLGAGSSSATIGALTNRRKFGKTENGEEDVVINGEGEEHNGNEKQDYLNCPFAVAVSPNGKHVYSINEDGFSIVKWDRDAITGELKNMVAYQDNSWLESGKAVAISPDGRRVYVLSNAQKNIVQYERDLNTGVLTNQAVIKDGNIFTGGRHIVASPDGNNIYVSSSGTGTGTLAQFSMPVCKESSLTNYGKCVCSKCLGNATKCLPKTALAEPNVFCSITGSYCNHNLAVCQTDACGSGKALDATDKTCQACGVGMYSNEDGLPFPCKSCVAGAVAATTGLAKCTPCKGGEYAKDPKSASCLDCPTGWFNSDEGDDDERIPSKHVTCAACNISKGFVAEVPGLKRCSVCPIGKLTTSNPAVPCESCPKGKMGKQTNDEKNTCSKCTEGNYQQ